MGFGSSAYTSNDSARTAMLNKAREQGYSLATTIDTEHHPIAVLASMLNDGFPSISFGDNKYLYFGDANDVAIRWDATNLTIKPVADDTGAIIIGDGTTDMDVKIFLKDTLNYALFDVGLQKVNLVFSTAGGDSAQGLDIDVAPLSGAGGYRQGGINVQVSRALGQSVTWDGNPDTCIKAIARNSAVNASNEGAVRGIDIQGRNSGTYTSWVQGASFNARNDSGKTTGDLWGMTIRAENYGTVSTSVVGLDINMSIENTTGSPSRTGIQIRNTDASGMTAVGNVFKVSHTSTNGFTYLFHFNSATGDTFATGDLLTTASADVDCDGYISVLVNATPYYIPVYDTVK